ncbi:MAG: hypothetical protein ACOC8E_09020 [Planctomycetota bacterium]
MIDRLWARRSEPQRDTRWTKPKAPELQRRKREIGDRLWREWIDSSIKALDGRSRREAAAGPDLRSELEALLRDFEERESRHSEPGSSWGRTFVEHVRRELGME